MAAELERDVEARSAGLKKELGLFDLVLTQILFVVGTFWVGWAAQLGYQQPIVAAEVRKRGEQVEQPICRSKLVHGEPRLQFAIVNIAHPGGAG